mgnify:CR=1 FL=1
MARLNCVTVLAPAKLNLALDVVGLLPMATMIWT